MVMGLVGVKKHEMDFQQSLTDVLAIPAVSCWELFCFRSVRDVPCQQVVSVSIKANSSFSFFVLKSYIWTLFHLYR